METNVNELSTVFEHLQLDRIVYAILALGVVIFIAKLLRSLTTTIETKLPSYRLLSLQISTVLTFAIYIFGTAAIVMGILKPTEKLILALGSSAAVAIGFSLKDLVASIVAGITLLFDRPFQVGDRVQYGDVYGEIQNIGLRTVRLTTLDDNLVTIPNSKFMSDVVSSGNAGALDMMITTDFHVSLDANLDLARKIINEVIYTSRFAFLKKPVGVVIQETEVARRLAIKLTAKAYVLDVRYEKAFQTDIVARTTKAFSAQGIKRPVLEPGLSS